MLARVGDGRVEGVFRRADAREGGAGRGAEAPTTTGVCDTPGGEASAGCLVIVIVQLGALAGVGGGGLGQLGGAGAVGRARNGETGVQGALVGVLIVHVARIGTRALV